MQGTNAGKVEIRRRKCRGRYYVDDETAREIEKLVRDLDRKLQIERTGDVFPAQNATIIKGAGGTILLQNR